MAVYNFSIASAKNDMLGASYLDDALKASFDKAIKEGFHGKGVLWFLRQEISKSNIFK